MNMTAFIPESRSKTLPSTAQEQPQGTMPPRLIRFLRSPWGCTLLTGALLWCSFFPLNWGWLGWVAMVPLLALCCTEVTPQRGRRLYLPICLMSFAFTLVMLQWIRLASEPMYATWVVVSLIVSWWYPLAVWLIRRLHGTLRVPLVLAAPVVWIALEYFRAFLYIGFAWYYLGHTQHDFLPIVQTADLCGAYGVSFLVMVVNVAVWEGLRWWWQRRTQQDTQAAKRRFVRAAVFAGTLFVLSLVYGVWQLQRETMVPGPRLALVQGNMSQDLRNQPGEVVENDKHFFELGEKAAALKPDILVLPETTFSGWWFATEPGVDQTKLDDFWQERINESEAWMKALAARWNCWIFLGSSSRYMEASGESRYNSAMLFDPEGRQHGRYDKSYLLPWGEYIPLAETLPFMKWFSPYPYEYSLHCGELKTVFHWKGIPFAVLICYEDSVPHLAHDFMQQPTPPAFFLNLSNDGWFKGSEEHEQHFVAARFRAIENRRAVARSVNMGISGVIDGNGRVIALPNGTTSWTAAKNCAAVIDVRIPLDQRTSLYSQTGDVVPTLCWFLIFPGMLLALRRAAHEEHRGSATAAHPV
jgi:apolipoprotein N-acyltransferase